MNTKSQEKPSTKLETPTTISGVPEAGVPLAIASLLQQYDALVHVAADDKRAEEVAACTHFFAPDAEVLRFPAWDVLPYDRASPNPQIVTERLETLVALAAPGKRKRVVMTTASAWLQKLPPKEVIARDIWHIQKGGEIDRERLTHWLQEHGYRAMGKAVESGEFAIRGSIIDIIPSGSEQGFRLDMFGDEVEQIRQFDPLSQKSEQAVDELKLLPASEILLTPEHVEHFRNSYRDTFGAISKSDALYEAVSAGARYPGMEHWLPLFYEHMAHLSDYVAGAMVVFDEAATAAAVEREEMICEYYAARKAPENQKYADAPYHPLAPSKLYLIGNERTEKDSDLQTCVFSGFLSTKHPPQLAEGTLTSPPPFTEGVGGRHVSSGEPKAHAQIMPPLTSPPQAGGIRESTAQAGGIYFGMRRGLVLADTAEKIPPLKRVAEMQREYAAKHKRILIGCYSAGSRERLAEMLRQHDVQVTRVDQWADMPRLTHAEIAIAVLPLTHGVETPEALILSEQDILGERLIRTARKKRSAEYFMQEAASFNEGELVVHREHGIGRFEKLETLDVAGAKHDCLKLTYDGGDRLFVPVENIDVLSRYGSEEEGVALDKLGSANWQARKAKLKERISIAAAELMKTAAERLLKPGTVLNADSERYGAFAERFGHVETEDQERSIEEVVGDLQSGKPMDRLVCGDVGFGKTEVALRAAFVAINPAAHAEQASAGSEEKMIEDPVLALRAPQDVRHQVAVIVPTTLLARQHYQNFAARFAGFGVNVRQISRMVSAKEAKLVKQGLKDGSVDIVIGTHALLARDVEFKRLGLVIIDEEQHFGVAQKEKLKSLKSDVHVLTLSATPIPRTLQMSLSGVRDLSLITTPPVDRLAVRSFIMPFDPVVIREALLREKNRAGGTFIVTPRIQDIGELKAKISELVPDFRIEVAHGQMSANDLDEIMNRFYERKIDVLISTAIIESGLDIPHANTIIIHKADRFGLAQLYQMRGRVGRSKTRAYAYFLLPHGKTLTRQATRRLEVMQTLDHLGAGFTLASHDMDIRGFGNLVGEEQSGHIREVGIELYQQMLAEAVAQSREAAAQAADCTGSKNGKDPVLVSANADTPQDWSPQINLGMSVLIPESYVSDLSLRMGLYRRIADARDESELDALQVEMVDRFGDLPEEAKTLFDIMRVKMQCRTLMIEKLDLGPKGIVLSFRPLPEHRAALLLKYIASHPTRVKLRPDQSLFISQVAQANHKLDGIRQFLDELSTKLC